MNRELFEGSGADPRFRRAVYEAYDRLRRRNPETVRLADCFLVVDEGVVFKIGSGREARDWLGFNDIEHDRLWKTYHVPQYLFGPPIVVNAVQPFGTMDLWCGDDMEEVV